MKKKISLALMLLLALFTTQTAFAQGKKDPGIYFEKTEFDYTIGQDEPFVEPKLINPNNVPVYFVSDNASAASVDFATGKVNFITQGTVKITAIAEETEMYSYSQVSYTINVTDNSIIFEASFIKDDCGFTQEGPVEGLDLWEHEDDGYMKADAFGVVDKMSSFYLISPEFTLSKGGNSVSFGECGSYFGSNWNKYALLMIREVGGEWQVIDRNYPTGDQYAVQSTGDLTIPSELNGKNVQLAFKYSSDGHSNSGVWHVRNLFVKSLGSTKIDAGIEFAKDSVYYLIGSGKEFVAPELINPNKLEIRYHSDNTDVAMVDELSGSVYIVDTGKVKITANSAETEYVKAGTASYTITVEDANEGDYANPAFRSPIIAIEFTGQRCRYCPNLARELQKGQDEYGKENYIIAALHYLKEYSQLPENYVSLYNKEAENYAMSMDIPSGLPQMQYNTLGTEVSDLTPEEMFKQDDLLEFVGSATYNAKNEYNIKIKTRLRSNMTNALDGKKIVMLCWALENNVEAFQDDNGTPTYPKHNHIFRGSVNSTWGELYKVGTTYENTLPVPESVLDVNNTEIVVLFYDSETRTILDAGTIEVKPGEETGIEEIVSDSEKNSAIYDLSGRKLNKVTKSGIYIKNGKKFIVR